MVNRGLANVVDHHDSDHGVLESRSPSLVALLERLVRHMWLSAWSHTEEPMTLAVAYGYTWKAYDQFTPKRGRPALSFGGGHGDWINVEQSLAHSSLQNLQVQV